MFNTFRSESLDTLARHFSGQVRTSAEDPLKPVWVVVQNNEIREWLSLKYAKHTGISGNFRFVFPSEFLWVMYRLRRPDLPQHLPSDLNAMHWTLFELFSNEKELLKTVPYYDMEDDRAWQRFQFAAQMADNFDQYQVYRPRMMEHWIDRKFVTQHKDEKWQLSLWNRLNDHWKENEETRNIPRRSEAFIELLEWLKDPEFHEEIPSRIHVFGLSHLPAPFLEMVYTMSTSSEVCLYQRSSTLSANDSELGKLCAKWNKPAAEQQALLQKLIEENQWPAEAQELRQEPQYSLPKLKVHSCHNRKREVQVLKDEILEYLEHNPEVGTEDILIMLPDAKAYAGLIETVFEEGKEGTALPVSRIRGRMQQSTTYAMSSLLELLSSTFKVSQVLDFMSLEPVREKFSFSPGRLELIEQWLLDNRIHFGLGEDLHKSYSWDKGWLQIMAGFTMEPKELEVYEGLVPYNGVRSTDEAELAANFSNMLHRLRKAHSLTRSEHTVQSWLEFVNTLLQDFLGNGMDESSSYAPLQKLTDKLKEQTSTLKLENPIPYGLFKSWFIGQLSSHSSSSGRYGQGITLSSYVPYRALPFKFIGILGMNESVFPRKAVRPEYDLIYADPEPGDRILKDDDTYLFLETIEACGAHLHLSFIGQDQRSDAMRLPSILIQQLLDHVQDDIVGGIIRHSLHPFNKRYFQETDLYSYSQKAKELASLMGHRGSEESPAFMEEELSFDLSPEQDHLHISDLISYYSEPCKYLLREKLDINEYDSHQELSDRELFKLKGLERYKLDAYIAQQLEKGAPDDLVYSYARANDMLPGGLTGEKAYKAEEEGIRNLLEQLSIETDGTAETVDIELNIQDVTLKGNIAGVYGNTLASFRVGARREHHEVAHWIRHLCLLEAGIPIERSVYLSKDKGELNVLELRSALITEDPLKEMIADFLKEQPALHKMCFFPKTSKAYAEEYLNSGSKEKARKKALEKWEVTQYHKYGDEADYYNHLVWRGDDPTAHEAFHGNAVKFWTPFLNAVGGDE